MNRFEQRQLTHAQNETNIHRNTKQKELGLKLEFEWSRQASGIEAVLIC